MQLSFFLLVNILTLRSYAVMPQKISSFVSEKLKAEKTTDVVVYLNEKAELQRATLIDNRKKRLQYVHRQLVKTAMQSQRELIKKLDKEKAAYRSFYIENAVVVYDANEKLIEQISDIANVKMLSPNIKSQLRLPKENSLSKKLADDGIGEHLRSIGVDKVWNQLSVKGRGIVIAGQDTGYDWKHPALKKTYRGFVSGKVDHDYNWHDAIHSRGGRCGANSTQPCDDGNHGTHTMGTMVGDAGKRNRIGVAPEAQWIGCRNMDRGDGTVATYLECFEFFMAPYPRGGNPRADGRPELAPHIINNSWSCPRSEGCTGGEFLETVRALKMAGIFVVVSAGNEGRRCSSVQNAPGTYAGDVFSVGAYSSFQRRIAGFSSRGPSRFDGRLAPNITAPGVSIRSSIPGGGYGRLSGTSMAGPHVAGVVALLWSAHPELIGEVDRSIEILQRTAKPKTSRQNCGSYKGSKIPNAVYGYGLINIWSAIQSLR